MNRGINLKRRSNRVINLKRRPIIKKLDEYTPIKRAKKTQPLKQSHNFDDEVTSKYRKVPKRDDDDDDDKESDKRNALKKKSIPFMKKPIASRIDSIVGNYIRKNWGSISKLLSTNTPTFEPYHYLPRPRVAIPSVPPNCTDPRAERDAKILRIRNRIEDYNVYSFVAELQVSSSIMMKIAL